MIGKAICALAACGLFLTACSPPPQTAPVDQSSAAFESQYFTVATHGSGPDVILVPGLASSAAIWDGTVAALQDRYKFHVIQVSGFGGADPRGNAGNDNVLDDLANELSRYSRTLGDDTAIVGHSLGGLVTLKTAIDPEGHLDRIVIVDVLPFFSVLMDPAATSQSIAPISAIMKATLLAQSDETFAARQAEALAALVRGEENRQLALSWSVASDRAVMAQAMSEVLVTDLRADIEKITVPTTVIYAKDDAIPNLDSVEAFYRDLYTPLGNGTLVPIEDGLHFIMLDQPEAFNQSLEAALSR